MIRNRSHPQIVERYDPSRNRTFHEVHWITESYGSSETHPLHVQDPSAVYVFPGIWPFIERAQSALGCDGHQYGRAKALWHITQLQNALGQIVKQDDRARKEVLEHINKYRMSLACALLGADNAILEICLQLGMPLPDYLQVKAEETIDGPIHACSSDSHGVGNDVGSAQDGRAQGSTRQSHDGKPRQNKPDRGGDHG